MPRTRLSWGRHERGNGVPEVRGRSTAVVSVVALALLTLGAALFSITTASATSNGSTQEAANRLNAAVRAAEALSSFTWSEKAWVRLTGQKGVSRDSERLVYEAPDGVEFGAPQPNGPSETIIVVGKTNFYRAEVPGARWVESPAASDLARGQAQEWLGYLISAQNIEQDGGTIRWKWTISDGGEAYAVVVLDGKLVHSLDLTWIWPTQTQSEYIRYFAFDSSPPVNQPPPADTVRGIKCFRGYVGPAVGC